MRQQPPLPGLVVSTPRRRAPVARPILPRPRPTFLLSRLLYFTYFALLTYPGEVKSVRHALATPAVHISTAVHGCRAVGSWHSSFNTLITPLAIP